MKRVALFTPGGFSDGTSTMYIPALVNIIQRLSKMFDITIYSIIKPDNNDKSFLCGNARVKYVPARFDESSVKKAFYYMKCFSADHLTKPYDLVHGFGAIPCGFVAVVLGKLFQVPSSVSLFGGETANLPDISYGNLRTKSQKALTLWVCRRSDDVITETLYLQQELQSLGVSRKLSIIPNGADVNLFRALRNGAPSPPYRFLHVANLSEVKDQTTLLKAFEMISKNLDCSLRIIGRGDLREKLEKFARELHIENKVTFLGYVRHQELPNHYAWADILLHTSLHEGGGDVIAEAAACGTVVCGTKTGFISDLEPEKAIGVDIGNAEMLAKNVVELLNDNKRFLQMREAAQHWSRSHSVDWTVEQMSQSYLELLKNTN